MSLSGWEGVGGGVIQERKKEKKGREKEQTEREGVGGGGGGGEGGAEKEMLFVGRLTFQQHASVSQGRICSDSFTCCHTEMEAAGQTF